MDNRETIQKLEELQALLDEAIYLGDYIEDGAFRETREKINALRAETGLPGGTPAGEAILRSKRPTPTRASCCFTGRSVRWRCS